MPHYFVDVRLGNTVIHDTEGEDFDDLNAASAAAPDRSRRVLECALPQSRLTEDHEIEIVEG